MIESCCFDKWVWAARFFKTRSLASDAVAGGKVHLNGKRIKPGKTLSVGDTLLIQRGADSYEVLIMGLSLQRQASKVASELYQESEESIQIRKNLVEMRRAAGIGRNFSDTKPNKQQRKKIVRFKRGN